ncbi:MAG: NAD+ synthetase [Bacteroides sp. SM23_62]|nr:MAG: NAD+ synthetase [Bacteroides sp. SM23_62]
MKVVLAQLNYHIGNFAENITRIAYEVKKAEGLDADLIVFSELAVTGYPPQDLLEYGSFIEESTQAIGQLASISNHVGILIGAPTLNPNPTGKKLFNSAYFLYNGQVEQVFHKTLLPTYDIFDEYRYFEPNREYQLLHFKGKKIAVTICEDLWFDQPAENAFSNSRLYTENPLEKLAGLDPDLIINLAASPFSYLRQQVKTEIFTNNARKFKLPIIYVNQVGAQTELVFEGGSLVVDRHGKIIRSLNLFSEDSQLVDLDDLLMDRLPETQHQPWERPELIYHALLLGIRDYFNKMNFQKATLGLSGGIDSAVTLVLAAEALGAENLLVLLMPSKYSSDHSLKDAKKLAGNLGVSYQVIPIQETFESFLSDLKPLFADLPEDITEENLQSRIRGTLLMALSNKFGHILLNTSNKSEAAVGYGTLYGDMAGGLSVLGDVYKTDVYRLAEFINRQHEIIPENILTKPPSAELKPDQKDTDSLPAYDILDQILYAYIEQQKALPDIIAQGMDAKLAERIIRLVNQNEYKRYQTPPILRISSKAFGVGRRMPLVAKY